VFTTALGLLGASALGARICGAPAGQVGTHGLILSTALWQLVCVPIGRAHLRDAGAGANTGRALCRAT
jgi:hypothetical protein